MIDNDGVRMMIVITEDNDVRENSRVLVVAQQALRFVHEPQQLVPGFLVLESACALQISKGVKRRTAVKVKDIDRAMNGVNLCKLFEVKAMVSLCTVNHSNHWY